MRSSQFIVGTFLLLAAFATNLANAQDELERFVERDSAAYIVIQDPEAILEQIEESVFLKNRHFQKALELLVDDEFSLATPDRLLDLQNKWKEIRQLLREFDEISVIIHSWPDEYLAIPKLTIALSGSQESSEQMKGILSDSKSYFINAKSDEPDFFSLMAGSQFSQVSIQQAGDQLLLTNASEESKRLKARIEQSEEKKFKSLSRSRSFQMVQKLLEKRSKEPQVRGYIAPKSFRRLITTFVAGENFIMIEPPKSIVSAGFQILLQYDGQSIETSDGEYKPVINWDFVLNYTRPSSGFGKLIDSFEPFEEFPSLPFPVTSLTATGFDLNAKHDASAEIFEKYQKKLFAPAKEGVSEGTTFEKYFGFSEFGVFRTADTDVSAMLDSSSGIISIYHEENPIHWKPSIEIRTVKDREAMEQLVAERVKSTVGERLIEIPCEHGRLFGRSEAGIRDHLESRAKLLREAGEKVPKKFSPRDGEPIGEDIMSEQYEFFVNDDWMLHCDHNSMRKFLNAAYEESTEPTAFDVLLRAAEEASGQSDFFKVDYQSNNFYKVENKRNLSSVEAVRIKAKHGTKGNDITPEAWDRLMAEPDEHGLRIKIESPEDAKAAVQQLISNAFNDSFGTVVSLYSKGDYKMRIFGQVYSCVDE